jgi:tetratricopeptide (TPR) repeat protein
MVDPCLDEAHSALAAANLLKLRGEWQAAIDKCMQVLALDEDDAAAHSLLGDIYRDQGRMDEAMHWYKLALDLNPDSPADKSKLEQIIAQSKCERPPVRNLRAEAIVTAKRVIAEAALAIGVLLLITTVWPVIFQPKPHAENPPGRAGQRTENPQRIRLPVTMTEPPETPLPDVRQLIEPSMSSHEDAMLQALNAAPRLVQRGLQVRSILIDPRNRSAIITLSGPLPGKAPATEALVRGSLIVLREACAKDNGLDQFTVRALYDGSAEVRFVADAQRSSVMSIDPEIAEYGELVAVLQNPWWAVGGK